MQKSNNRRYLLRSGGFNLKNSRLKTVDPWLFLPLRPMKNYIGQPLWLALLVLLLLTSLSMLPGNLKIGDFDLRKMDIFADIRGPQAAQAVEPEPEPYIPDTTAYFLEQDTLPLDTSVVDTARQVEFVPQPSKDSTYFGKVMEDYTPNQTGLKRFFAAIDSIRRGRTVRVAWYGDSFVEGDILIGDLRDSLQSAWGGNGVGFVPITSEVARFRRSFVQEFRGWTTYSIVKKNVVHPPFGLDGHVCTAAPDAKIHYTGAHYFRHTNNWTQVRFFYTAANDLPFVWQNEGGEPKMETLKAHPGQISAWKCNQPAIHAFALRFPEPEGLLAYGASLEDGPGFYIDNFSVRGNSGGPLKQIKPDIVRQFDTYQKYDLVIIQVGLNAVTNSTVNVKWYRAELDRTFTHLRACFPDKPILVISVGDRAGKNGTELATMLGVPAIVAMQRELARQHGFLFYDLFWGMGGPGTMIRLAQHRPMLANLDYTHLTHEGGKVVGLQFARLFLEEQAQYKTRLGK